MINFISPINEITIQKKGIIKVRQGISDNEVRIKYFIDNIKNGKMDKIILVFYTREGDPIIKTIKAKRRNMVLKDDNRRDRYAPFIDKFVHVERISRGKFLGLLDMGSNDFLKVVNLSFNFIDKH